MKWDFNTFFIDYRYSSKEVIFYSTMVAFLRLGKTQLTFILMLMDAVETMILSMFAKSVPASSGRV